MPRSSKYDSVRSKPPLALAFVATFASTAALTVLYNNARNPQMGLAEIEQETTQELSRIGFTWARVSIKDGVATIEGEAPGESERVIAYDVVRRTLRPLMGRSRVIEGVSSHLKLSPQAVTALANANAARGANGSDYYLSADANLPYPAPPIVTGATDIPADTGAKATEAVLEPTAVPDNSPAAVARAVTTAVGPEVTAAAPASAVEPLPAPEPAAARVVTIETPITPEAATTAVPAVVPADVKTTTAEQVSEPDRPEHEVAIAPSPVPEPTPEDNGTPAVAQIDPSGAALASTVGVGSATARPPVQTAARQRTRSAPIETAALDAPAAPAQPAATAGAATDANPALDPTTDCKAEFADALSQSTVEFASNSAIIERQSRPLLDKLAQIAKHCSRFRLVVEGHTDLSGSKAHNQTLSQKRADAVRWALVDRGVDMDHITAQGFGSSRPLIRGTSDAANARNRRIEFSVLEPQPRSHNASAAH